jgi:uncharacterized RDD family membrane protein YckC
VTTVAELPAGFWLRVAAGAIDIVLLATVVALLTWFGLTVADAMPENRPALVDAIAQLWRDALLLPTVLLVVIAMAICWSALRATPGQSLMGCRVARRRSGGPLNFFVALWRSLLLVASGGAVALPLLTMFFDPRRRGLHDWLSDSIVVVEDESSVCIDEWMKKLD